MSAARAGLVGVDPLIFDFFELVLTVAPEIQFDHAGLDLDAESGQHLEFLLIEFDRLAVIISLNGTGCIIKDLHYLFR